MLETWRCYFRKHYVSLREIWPQPGVTQHSHFQCDNNTSKVQQVAQRAGAPTNLGTWSWNPGTHMEEKGEQILTCCPLAST